jgi:FkbM family methyltransferase
MAFNRDCFPGHFHGWSEIGWRGFSNGDWNLMSPQRSEPEDLAEAMSRLSDTIERKSEEILLQLRLGLLGPDKVLEFLSMDKVIRLHLPFAAQDHVQRAILSNRQFFEFPVLEQVAKLIKPGASILDAGANIGNHSIFFSAICGAKIVYAFEPMFENYKILQKNIELNGVSNIVAYNRGLGDGASRANLKYYSNRNLGAATLQIDDAGPYDLVSLDSLDLKELEFVKIDVEGFHLEVLAGAEQTLARCKPMIWIELRDHPEYREYESGDALLRKFGYRQVRKLRGANFLYAPG